jgi:hypothetical protein
VLLRYPELAERRRGWVLAGTEVTIPLTARLERSFAARVSGLSPSSRSALIVGTAADSDDFAEIAAAVMLAVPGAAAEALSTGADAGILVVSQATVTFEHPLIRSAIYQSADADMRRRGASMASVAAWEQAARLTPRPGRRARGGCHSPRPTGPGSP